MNCCSNWGLTFQNIRSLLVDSMWWSSRGLKKFMHCIKKKKKKKITASRLFLHCLFLWRNLHFFIRLFKVLSSSAPVTFLCSLAFPNRDLNHLVLRDGTLYYLLSECILLISNDLQDILRACIWHHKYIYKWISVLYTNILQVPFLLKHAIGKNNLFC